MIWVNYASITNDDNNIDNDYICDTNTNDIDIT